MKEKRVVTFVFEIEDSEKAKCLWDFENNNLGTKLLGVSEGNLIDESFERDSGPYFVGEKGDDYDQVKSSYIDILDAPRTIDEAMDEIKTLKFNSWVIFNNSGEIVRES